jgi:hypothetical protein
MTTFPGSPRLHKGAIIELDPEKPLASIIVFQYNPESMTRTLEPQTMDREASRGVTEALRLTGPPHETVRLDIEIDATDQLEKQEDNAMSMGIYPTLSALEMLLYPKSALVNANDVLLNLGIIEVVPPEAPLTLLVWGIKRVLPVRLTSFSITEQAFDPDLNPILAKVSLEFRVLNYQDLGLSSVGGSLFMAHQIAKEVMATIGSIGNITSLPSMF